MNGPSEFKQQQGEQYDWSREAVEGWISEHFAQVSEWDEKLLRGCELEMIWSDLGFKRITLATALKIKYVREGEQEQKWEVQLGGYYSNPTRDDDNSDQTCEKWLDSEYFEGRHKGFSDGLHMGMRKGEDSRMIPQFWPKAVGGQNYILRWENCGSQIPVTALHVW